MACDRLFVYGTLRKSVPDSKGDLFSANASYLSLGRTLGRLYRISWHPGMTPGDAGEWVLGEVWKLHDADDTFRVLDEFEGPDYERIVVTIELGEGAQLDAWTYFYRGSIEGKPRLESGDWADYAGQGA